VAGLKRTGSLRIPLVSLLLASATFAAPAFALDGAADAASSAAPADASSATVGSAAPATPAEQAAALEEELIAPKAGEIVVVASRIKGQVDAPQTPIQVLGPWARERRAGYPA
jgi:hypothetical protein